MTAETELRVQELCHKLLSLKTVADADLESLLAELRSALREHIHLARNSLEEQTTTLFLLEGILRSSSESKLFPEEK